MGRIRKLAVPRTDVFVGLEAEAKQVGEYMDCSVKAVAVVTGRPYVEILAAFSAVGRRDRKRTGWHLLKMVLEQYGLRAERVPASHFISRYPGGHKFATCVTTHHPDRFKDVWRDGKTYLLSPKGHVAAVVNGTNHDWTRGTAKRVMWIFEVVSTSKGN